MTVKEIFARNVSCENLFFVQMISSTLNRQKIKKCNTGIRKNDVFIDIIECKGYNEENGNKN